MSPDLSPAQRRALDLFHQPGGHGYGEHAHLGRRTALALARRGLVVLGHKRSARGRVMPWGIAPGAEPPYGWVPPRT